jgi:hypothetical protein
MASRPCLSSLEYVRGDVHVNIAEGYFSQLKRSIDGTYHHVSEGHLDKYLEEFDYRYNTRKIDDGNRHRTSHTDDDGQAVDVAPADRIGHLF